MAKYVNEANLQRFWDNIQDQIGSASQEQVDAWLDEHPEATTTVQDGSIPDVKLVQTGGILETFEQFSNAAYPELASSDFTWTLGKTISSSGAITNQLSLAMSDMFSVTGGTLIVNKSDELGMNDKPTVFWVSQYIGDTWQKRTQVAVGNGLVLDATTNGVRIVFGYAGSAGNTETQEDIDAHFKTSIVSQAATKAMLADYLGLRYTDATTLSSNTDYDTLTTPGNYRVTSASTAQTMTNCPATVAHRLMVMTPYNSTRVLQIVFANDAQASTYFRVIGNSWVKLSSSYDSLQTKPSIITQSNYTNFFTDANDAPINSVYSIAGSTPIAHLPDGANIISAVDETSGYPAGTLMTIKGGTSGALTQVVQIFSAQSAAIPQTIFCIRNAYISDGSLLWSAWTQMSDVMCLTGANYIFQEARLQAGQTPFTDCDDAPNNSIYQIDLDCVSLANNPLSGHSSILVTIAFSFVSRHGMMQFSCGLNNGVQLYVRYCYKQSADNYVWTPWRHLVTEAI